MASAARGTPAMLEFPTDRARTALVARFRGRFEVLATGPVVVHVSGEAPPPRA